MPKASLLSWSMLSLSWGHIAPMGRTRVWREGYSPERRPSALAPPLRGSCLQTSWHGVQIQVSALRSPGSVIDFLVALGGALERLGGCLATQQGGWLPSA